MAPVLVTGLSDMIRSHAFAPFLAVLLGIAAFSAMDAVMKSAALEAGVYTALLFRNMLGTLFMLPVWLLTGRALPSAPALKVHIHRALVVAVMALLFFYGLVRIPIAEAIAISFIAPLIALYFAAIMLGETIQRRAIIASLLGVAGVIVIGAARFGQGDYDAESIAGISAILVSAVLYALNLILQRRQALLASPAEIALVQNLFVGLLLLLAAPWLATWPSVTAWRDITAGAILATSALLLLSWGYARAEAQALVPIEYTGFLWAMAFGWLWLGEKVGLGTFAGAALIVVGCLIAARKPTEQTAL